MRVALLGAANSSQIVRWANGLAQSGLEVHLISLRSRSDPLDPNVYEYTLPFGQPVGYVAASIKLRKLLERIRPDILNVHYASGYGLLARLARFTPTLLSVWGCDVYHFPTRGFLQRWILVGNLRRATAIASTSHAMARQVRRLVDDKRIIVTPFGVDTDRFNLIDFTKHPIDECTIGTVKTLEYVYGIDTLIRAFAIVKEKLNSSNKWRKTRLRLLIVGGGIEKKALIELSKNLGINGSVEFVGNIAHDQVVQKLEKMDIFVALSRRESFGVAILEASSCGLPVVVSNADGPAEIVVNGETGFVVERDNAEAAAEHIYQLVIEQGLRQILGKAGRAHVEKEYMWSQSINLMVDAYKQTIAVSENGN